jgi:hypothetical protein
LLVKGNFPGKFGLTSLEWKHNNKINISRQNIIFKYFVYDI